MPMINRIASSGSADAVVEGVGADVGLVVVVLLISIVLNFWQCFIFCPWVEFQLFERLNTFDI